MPYKQNNIGVLLETKQRHWYILRSVSTSFFQLKQLRCTYVHISYLCGVLFYDLIIEDISKKKKILLLFLLNCNIPHDIFGVLQVIVRHPKREIIDPDVIIYSLLCHYKPVWLTFVFHGRKMIFWRMWITKTFWFLLTTIVFFCPYNGSKREPKLSGYQHSSKYRHMCNRI